MENALFEKVILQELSEKFGFEEAKIYWGILNNKNLNGINRNKKYRLFQSLFNDGLLLKIKERKLFEYIPVPPTFISLFFNTKTRLIEEKEKVYSENYFHLFQNKRIFMELKAEVVDGLILFLIKYFMKKSALLIIGGPPIYLLLKQRVQKFKDIKFIGITEYFKNKSVLERNITLLPLEIVGDRRLCLIDNLLLIMLFKTIDNTYSGYITTEKIKLWKN